MYTVNYITRPFLLDTALELLQELKVKCKVNFIIVVSPWNIDYFELERDKSSERLSESFEVSADIEHEIRERYKSYFSGANVILRFEPSKETSFSNVTSWIKLLSKNNALLKADLNILDSLNISDAYFLFRIRKKRVYHILHDPVPHTGETKKRLKLLRNVYFRYIDKFLLYSNFSTDLFKQNFPLYQNKYLTLQIPICNNLTLKFNESQKSDKSCVLFFGRISPYKGVDLFYSAAQQLTQEFPDIDFVIAGKSTPSYRPEFLGNNLNPNIKILNRYIDLETLSRLMTNSMFCVLPYLDATQSGVVMTAYAFGLPVLVSDCPGLLEPCFEPEYFSFSNGDLTDLIKKMRYLINNKINLEDYREKIKSYAMTNVSKKNVVKILDF